MKRYLLIAVALMTRSLPSLAGTFALVPGPDLSGDPGTTLTWQLASTNTDASLYLQILGVAGANYDGSQVDSVSFGTFSFPAIPPSTPIEIDDFYSLTWAATATPGYAFAGDFTITSAYCEDDLGNGCGNPLTRSFPIRPASTSRSLPPPNRQQSVCSHLASPESSPAAFVSSRSPQCT